MIQLFSSICSWNRLFLVHSCTSFYISIQEKYDHLKGDLLYFLGGIFVLSFSVLCSSSCKRSWKLQQKLLSPTEMTHQLFRLQFLDFVLSHYMSHICIIYALQLVLHIRTDLSTLLCCCWCWVRHVWADQSRKSGWCSVLVAAKMKLWPRKLAQYVPYQLMFPLEIYLSSFRCPCLLKRKMPCKLKLFLYQMVSMCVHPPEHWTQYLTL